MHIQDIIKQDGPSLSFEFFPPRTKEASDALYETIAELEPYKPSFVSVTYGAGGTTRDLTHDLVLRIKETTAIPPVPHLTCIGHTKAEIESILIRYAEAGVSNILALRGDPPRDNPNYDRSGDDFKFAADLVAFIKKFNESGRHPDPRGFGIGVAGFPEGHPATPNRMLEMEYLKAKVDAGAGLHLHPALFRQSRFPRLPRTLRDRGHSHPDSRRHHASDLHQGDETHG